MASFDGHSIVVTGASGGVGSACVEELTARGAHVIGLDLKSTSAAHEHYAIDSADPECGIQLAEVLGGRPIRGLVNNAGVAHYSDLSDTSIADYDHVLAVNLRAPFLYTTATISNLSAGQGSIVNVVSVHSRATSRGAGAYAASKGGLEALTRSMAVEWAECGVRANCVLPGAVFTPMLVRGWEGSGDKQRFLEERTPLGRIGLPAEVAAVIVFLLEPSGAFLTGASVVVDGGVMARLSSE